MAATTAARVAARLLRRCRRFLADGTLVGLDTGVPNRLVDDPLASRAIAPLSGYARRRREIRDGAENSRVDLLLEDDARPPCWVGIKDVHGRVGSVARFADAVTARGAKHLRELAVRVAIGERAVMIYVIRRGDCTSFGLAREIDPA